MLKKFEKLLLIKRIAPQEQNIMARSACVCCIFYNFANLASMTFVFKKRLGQLSCFHTSLLLDALLLLSANTAYCFIVRARYGLFAQSGLPPKLNQIQLFTICHCGQSSKVINLLAQRCKTLFVTWSSLNFKYCLC